MPLIQPSVQVTAVLGAAPLAHCEKLMILGSGIGGMGAAAYARNPATIPRAITVARMILNRFISVVLLLVAWALCRLRAALAARNAASHTGSPNVIFAAKRAACAPARGQGEL